MNGWQRLWIFIGVPWVAITVFAVAINYDETGVVWGGVASVSVWLLLYIIGLGVGWVIRGFRNSK